MAIIVPKKWMTVIGCMGFGLIILTFGIYAVTSNFSWYIKLPLGIGIVSALTFWILSAMTSRTARYGSNVAVMIFLAFFILVLVNFVSARRFSRIDTTKNKQFSLSEQTIKILKNLDQNINVNAFYTEDHYRRRVAEDILKEYALQSNKIRLNFIDPNVKPGLAIAYDIKQNGTVVFEMGERREEVESYQNEEQDFTSAILKLTSDEQKKIYFLDGHGEHDIDAYADDSYGELKNMIEAENYLTEKLVLASRPSIPEDCEILIIGGPQKPLLPDEEETISAYLRNKGKAIIMLDPPPAPSMNELLAEWGINVNDDIIMDGFGQTMFGDPRVPVTVKYEYHDITIPISRVMTFFPMARSLKSAQVPGKKLEVTELVKTSNESWGEVDIESLMSDRRVSYDDDRDIKGPMSIAIAVVMKEEKEGETPTVPGQPPQDNDKENRILVVFGDSDFVTNKWLSQGNPDLFMNALNWLSEEEELISIRPKDQEQSQIQRLTGGQLRLVTYSSIFAIPLILLIAGGLVWWKRR
jgi:ABC-type uncharacterized transport system involved in gliding motility auxiliary subunit